ncbi:MAG: type II secretion system GspH family protein [Lentisphaeria bacterium]|nr:type II secretion system GspH family protein [Lentisphaeria bacterium]
MNKKFFTLIEILVVIAIIGILSSLVLGVFSKTREKGRRIACASQLQQLGLAIHMYVNNHADQLPTSERLAIFIPLDSYVQNKQLYNCPGDNEDDGLFATDGTSYEWNTFVNGKKIDRSNFQILGLNLQLPLLFDGDFYHGNTKNQLFNDGRVEIYESLSDVVEN